MQIDRVWVKDNSVEIDVTDENAPSVKRTTKEKGADPTTALKGALVAFTSYVVWVHSLEKTAAEEGVADSDIGDRITVRGVSVKRPDDAPRGITVTALMKCPRARNSTSTLNTPFMTERPEGGTGEGKGFLPLHIPDLIDRLEQAALAYYNGERGEQTKLALDDENVKGINDRMAAAEVASTKKPRGKKPPNAWLAEIYQPWNPDSTEAPPDDEQLRQLLLSVDLDVPVDAIGTWIRSERLAAEGYARQRQKEMITSEGAMESALEQPACVAKSATLPLTANEWTPPPKPSAEALDELRAAVEYGK